MNNYLEDSANSEFLLFNRQLVNL